MLEAVVHAAPLVHKFDGAVFLHAILDSCVARRLEQERSALFAAQFLACHLETLIFQILNQGRAKSNGILFVWCVTDGVDILS